MGSNAKDLKGQTFGDLTAIRDVGVAPNGNRLWLCRCICGNEITVRQNLLHSGKKSNCGCVPRQRRNSKNIKGERFGNLIAEEDVGKDKKGYRLWRCICDCGNEKIVSVNRLHSGGTKSCGCLLHFKNGIVLRCPVCGVTVKTSAGSVVLCNKCRVRMLPNKTMEQQNPPVTAGEQSISEKAIQNKQNDQEVILFTDLFFRLTGERI